MSNPGQGTETSFPTENILAGKNIVRSDAIFVAGTYKRGELVGRVTATGKYTTYDAGGVDGSEIIRAVCMKDITLVADGYLPIAKGEFQKVGVTAIMAGLTVPITVNDVILAACDDAGIILN